MLNEKQDIVACKQPSKGHLSHDQMLSNAKKINRKERSKLDCESKTNPCKMGPNCINIHEQSPLNQIQFYLDRYRIKDALTIFFDEETLKILREDDDFMWDIIPLICKRLRGLCQYRFRVFEGCEKMLCRIAVDEGCNPKEVLISLLAEITLPDVYNDDNVFRAMIRPLEGALLRISHPTPRDDNLRWVLNVLLHHINDIEVLTDYNLEGKKRSALHNDPTVKRFIEVLPLLLSFIEEFNDRPLDFDKSPMPILTESQINEVLNGELVDDENVSSRSDTIDASISALLSIMNRPLACLDLTTYCNDLRLFSNRCLNTLLKLRPNLFSPIYKMLNEKSSVSLGNLSLATCAYIYRCERVVLLEAFPLVITHEFSLICHMPYIVSLLERSETIVHEKGLLLIESLIKQLDNDSLGQNFLDLFETSSLLEQLFRVMVYSPLCTNRRKAYDIFTLICDLLDHDCKLKLFKDVLTKNHLRPCVRAACIDQYRKHLRYKAISGQVLVDFLNLCIKACLPDSQHTDIIENYELLLATLTIFRFLKLRTIPKDVVEEEYLSGKKLKKLFFDPIRNAIALIMSELKLHHKDIVEGHKMKNTKITQSSILNVTQSRNELDLLSRILGPKLDDVITTPEPPVQFNDQDEADCLNWALCRLDLVESVLVRTCELYDC